MSGTRHRPAIKHRSTTQGLIQFNVTALHQTQPLAMPSFPSFPQATFRGGGPLRDHNDADQFESLFTAAGQFLLAARIFTICLPLASATLPSSASLHALRPSSLSHYPPRPFLPAPVFMPFDLIPLAVHTLTLPCTSLHAHLHPLIPLAAPTNTF